MKAKLGALLAVPALAFGLAGCSSDSPAGADVSQKAFSEGLTNILSDYLSEEGIEGLDASLISDYSACVTENSWDAISDDTKKVVGTSSPSELKSAQILEKDFTAMQPYLNSCVDKVIAPGLAGSN